MSTATSKRTAISGGASAADTFVVLLTRDFWPVAIYPKGTEIPGRDKPAEGKEPIGSKWGLERWDVERANAAFKRWRGAGLGICLGPDRGPGGAWLIDVEGDGPEAEASRAILFGGEAVETMGWGSARGGHQLLVADPDRLGPIMPGLAPLEGKGVSAGVFKSDRLPGLELRLGGFKGDGTVKQVQSVVPPTPGTDGVSRCWIGPKSVAPAPDAFYHALADLVTRPSPERPKPGLRPGTPSGRWTPEMRATAYLQKCEPAVSGRKGHTKAFKAACKAGPGFDLVHSTLLRLLKEVWNPTCDPPWSDGELQHKVDEAYRVETRRGWLLDEGRADGGPKRSTPPADSAFKVVGGEEAEDKGAELPAIEITPERHRAVDAAVVALAGDGELYSRLGSLVSVVRETEDNLKLTGRTSMRNLAGSPRIVELSESTIGCRLTKHASFYQWKKIKGGEEIAMDVHPPDWLIRSVATRKHWPGIRPLLAVVETPFPRPDGSLVEVPGYDPETGTLYAPSIDFPPIPTNPTREDARGAWARIAEQFRHFPFATEDDRIVVLAGMLTVIARPAILGSVPGIAVIGNKAGTGKGILIDGMCIPGTGRPAPTSAYPSDQVEAAKVKVSIALAARTVVHFDNLEEGSLYGNGALDSALTAPTVDDRVLGAAKLVGELRLRASWFLSGNNINPGRDAFRRWLVVNLITDLEHPERRADLGEESFRSLIGEARGWIVRDVLTILRAHAMAGRPGAGWGPLGSFDEWDRIVRRAVWYATDRDCLTTQRKTAEDSQDRHDKLALLEGWLELPGQAGGITTNKAVEMVEGNPARYPTLWGVMLRLGKAGKPMTSAAIGFKFRGLKNNRIDGLMLREAGKEHQATLWGVESARPRGGEDGEDGEHAPNSPVEDLSFNSDTITYLKNRESYGGPYRESSPSSYPPREFQDPDDFINRPGIY